MPSFVGPIEINEVDSGTIKVGDSFSISPKASLKSALGSGALNVGDYVKTFDVRSKTNEHSKSFFDQPIIGNR
ncbi:spore germination protein [Aeribacillus sp. FSL K6-8394]|uniref:spore germination protein n=1 Tax=Aeribacillus sp. FSL K6-8394 TaxID=2954570 RepID=UPI0030F6EB1A